MILEELKNDIKAALQTYIKQFHAFKDISKERQNDIRNIHTILQSQDPLVVFDKLTCYIENLNLPLINWLKFIDINNFYWTLKTILQKEKYQVANFFRQTTVETRCKTPDPKPRPTSHLIDQKIEDSALREILADVKLLRAENSYLYTTLKTLNDKVIRLESESLHNLQRAQNAEEGLLNLEKKYSSLTRLGHPPKMTQHSFLTSDGKMKTSLFVG